MCTQTLVVKKYKEMTSITRTDEILRNKPHKNAQNLKYTWKATQALLSKLKDIIVWDKQTS